jgi:hypothetical protein
MTPFATIAQLDAWLGRPSPADAPRLLDRASEVVAGALRTKVATDATTGLPTDPTTAQTLADATCAQVESWLDDGECDRASLAPHAWSILRTGGLLNAAVEVR